MHKKANKCSRIDSRCGIYI
uniref:Uncharacterized protein n=1 Tax=Anguilla anguilla TaxID=7936 RepID=A0A0E9VFJ1_ANGAN